MNTIEKFKKGSRIHIKPSHKGLFTKYCGGNVTSECIARGKRSSDPKIRRRATFALNSRRWKHLNGGKFQEGGIIDRITNGFWKFGDVTGLYDKQGFKHMFSDLQDFGILPRGGEDGKLYGIISPAILHGEGTITIPKGMTGEELSSVMMASKANPAFNEAERLALLDFQAQFGKGMPIATRRGRLALKDAFGNNVRYPIPRQRTLVLLEGETGRLLQARLTRTKGGKVDSRISRQNAYRDLRRAFREDLEINQGSRAALEQGKIEKAWATGNITLKRGRKPVKIYLKATLQLLINRPNSVEANESARLFKGYVNAKNPKSKSDWLNRLSEYIDRILKNGFLGGNE